MKKFVYGICIILFLTACSKDDDSIDTNKLVGQWKLTTKMYSEIDNRTGEVLREETNNENFPSMGMYDFVLYENGTGSYIDVDGKVDRHAWPYDVFGNTIRFYFPYGFGENELKVEELSAYTLRLSAESTNKSIISKYMFTYTKKQ